MITKNDPDIIKPKYPFKELGPGDSYTVGDYSKDLQIQVANLCHYYSKKLDKTFFTCKVVVGKKSLLKIGCK